MGVVWKEIGMRLKPHDALTIIVSLFPLDIQVINSSWMFEIIHVPVYSAFI